MAGFGPYQFNFFYPFQRLVPYKLMHLVDLTQLDPPVRVEPSAPAGFYEDIQWSLGPLGGIGFSFVTGMLEPTFIAGLSTVLPIFSSMPDGGQPVRIAFLQRIPDPRLLSRCSYILYHMRPAPRHKKSGPGSDDGGPC